MRQSLFGEIDGSGLGDVRSFAAIKKSDYADQGAIAAMTADRVLYKIKLGPIFAGYNTAMRLVPVKDQFAIEPFGHDVAIYGEQRTIGTGD